MSSQKALSNNAALALPTEVWNLILLHQPSESLYDTLLVCKAFKKIILSASFLLQNRSKLENHYGIILLGNPTKDWVVPASTWSNRKSQAQEVYVYIVPARQDESLSTEFTKFMQRFWYAEETEHELGAHGSHGIITTQQSNVFYRGLCFSLGFQNLIDQSPTILIGTSYLFIYRNSDPDKRVWLDLTGARANTESLFSQLETKDIDPILTYFDDTQGSDEEEPLEALEEPLPEFFDSQSSILLSDDNSIPKLTLSWFNVLTNELECRDHSDRALLELLVERKLKRGIVRVSNPEVQRNYLLRKRKFQTGETIWWVQVAIAFFVALLSCPFWAISFLFHLLKSQFLSSHSACGYLQGVFMLATLPLCLPLFCVGGLVVVAHKTYELGVPDVFFYYFDSGGSTCRWFIILILQFSEMAPTLISELPINPSAHSAYNVKLYSTFLSPPYTNCLWPVKNPGACSSSDWMGNASDRSVWKDINKQQTVDREKFEKIWGLYSKNSGFISEPKLSLFIRDVATHLLPSSSEDQILSWLLAVRSDFYPANEVTTNRVLADIKVTKLEVLRLFSLLGTQSPTKLTNSMKKLSTEEEFYLMTKESPSKIRIAILSDFGVDRCCIDGMKRAVANKAIFQVLEITGLQIGEGILQKFEFHCFMHPGGNAGMTMSMLKDSGKDRVRDFVASGGGYFGICAGAIAAGSEWHDYLNIAAVSCEAFPAHGKVKLDIKTTEVAKYFHLDPKKAMKAESEFLGGPLMRPLPTPGLPSIENPDAVFDSDIIIDVLKDLKKRLKAEKSGEAPEGQWTCEQCTFINKNTERCTICEYHFESTTSTESEYSNSRLLGSVRFLQSKKNQMPGAWAVVRTTYGSGRVLLISPHPELNDQEFVVTSGVYWLVEELRQRGLSKGEHVHRWTKEELLKEGEESD